MRKLLSLGLLLLAMLIVPLIPQPVQAMTGSGTQASPYIIYSLADLQNVGVAPFQLDAWYELANNIDASDTANWGTLDMLAWEASTTYHVDHYVTHGGNYYLCREAHTSGASFNSQYWWNYGSTEPPLYVGFVPIGSRADGAFSGHFDGKGYTISGLFINRPAMDQVGLFSSFSSGASVSVRNVALAGCDITGSHRTGALVGEIQGSSSTTAIENCHVQGTITGHGISTGGLIGRISTDSAGLKEVSDCTANVVLNGYNAVGGIAGSAQGVNVITRCHTLVNITATDDGGSLGGVYGYAQNADIVECSASGSISSPDGFTQLSTGGLVGFASDISVYIYRCYADVNLDLTGTGEEAGGLTGFGGRLIQDSYARGDVLFPLGSRVGGLVGYLPWNRTVERSYSTGQVTGASDVGGLIGYGEEGDGAIVVESFWDIETSGQATSDGGTGYPTEQMTDICIYEEMGGWCIAEATLPAGYRNDGYPVHGWVFSSGYDWLIHAMPIDLDAYQVVHFQPEAIIVGTTLPNLAGGGGVYEDGIFSWGTNPAGIETRLDSFLMPESVYHFEPIMPGARDIIEPEPGTMTGGVDLERLASNPFHPLAQVIASAPGITLGLAWLGLAILVLIAIMLVVQLKGQHMVFTSLAGVAVATMFYSIGVWGLWVVILLIFGLIASVVYERMPTL